MRLLISTDGIGADHRSYDRRRKAWLIRFGESRSVACCRRQTLITPGVYLKLHLTMSDYIDNPIFGYRIGRQTGARHEPLHHRLS
ncbi:MAG: hypothetical protein ACKO8O_04795, partial [Betaproteobacteria bacterium]